MSEASESYEVTIISELSGSRVEIVTEPSTFVTSAELINAFGALLFGLTIAIAQISDTVGPGPAATTSLTL